MIVPLPGTIAEHADANVEDDLHREKESVGAIAKAFREADHSGLGSSSNLRKPQPAW